MTSAADMHIRAFARALMEAGPDARAEVIDALAPVLAHIGSSAAASDDDGWIDARQAATYLGISLDALHRLTAARAVPCAQSGARARCFFKRSDLDAWRCSGEPRTGQLSAA